MVNFTDNLLQTWNINFQNSKALSSNLKFKILSWTLVRTDAISYFVLRTFTLLFLKSRLPYFPSAFFSKLSTDGTLASNLSEKRELYEYSTDCGNAEQDISSLFFSWVKLDAAKNKHHYQLIWPVQNNMQKWSWLRDTIWNAQKIGICR